ncbi:MAG: hypothetical protein K0S45_3967 [Nitrospira sp.]|nr:hypothetical protein [Nitrospira sp.]
MVSRISAVGALYLLAGSFFSLIVLFYRLQGHWATLSSAIGAWVAIIILVGLLALASVSLLYHYRHSRRTGSKEFRFILSMGFIGIALCFLSGEVIVRVLAEETPEGPFLANTVLLPREWPRVLTHRRSIWEQASREYGVFTADDALGWTVGPNRSGAGPHGETYVSSADGLRTLRSGASLREQPAALRIAILGDSYTFGQDVSFEDTWGHRLETLMGPGVQVLNFGVPAYGIDQAYARYLRDVRDWRPDIVILSFISHDLVRSGMVYYWIGFPGAAVPGAKPRFSLAAEELTLVNVPLPSQEHIYSTSTIGDLPFIQSDSMYQAVDWEWHLYQYSYFFRFAISWQFSPLSSSYALDDDVRKVNEAIFTSFVRTAQAEESLPIVVFLPEYHEFQQPFGTLAERDLLGRRVAREAGVEFVDLTPCLEAVASGDRFTTGWHYTPHANAAVARCLQSEIMKAHAATQSQKSVTP